MHTMFEDLLYEARISADILELARAIFIDSWEDRKQVVEQEHRGNRDLLEALEHKIEVILDKFETTKRVELIEIYEKRLESLLAEKRNVEGLIINKPILDDNKFGTSLKKVKETLKNPISLWKSDYLEDKRTILFMYFESGLQYDYIEGFGTAKYSESINLLCELESQKSKDVEMPGSDPGSECFI